MNKKEKGLILILTIIISLLLIFNSSYLLWADEELETIIKDNLPVWFLESAKENREIANWFNQQGNKRLGQEFFSPLTEDEIVRWTYTKADLDGTKSEDYLLIVYGAVGGINTVVILKKENDIYAKVWELPEDSIINGYLSTAEIILDDIDADNKPEINISFSSGNPGTDIAYLIKWQGQTGCLLEPQEFGNAIFVDLDNDGKKEAVEYCYETEDIELSDGSIEREYNGWYTISRLNGLEYVFAQKITEDDLITPITTALGIDGLWHNCPVTVTLKVSNGGLGVDRTYYSIDGSEPTLGYSGPFTIYHEGSFTIKYYSVDNIENSEEIQTSSLEVRIDKTPPSGNILINHGAGYTSSPEVILTLPVSDSLSGMETGAEMRISNSNPADWSSIPAIPYSKSRSWILSSSNGIKTVYAKFKDVAGNWSNVSSAVIFYSDKTPPQITNIQAKAKPPQYKAITFTADVIDKESGVEKVTLSWRKKIIIKFWKWRWSYWRTPQTTPMFDQGHNSYKTTLYFSQAGNEIKYYIEAKDKSGNSKKTDTYTITR